MELQLTAEQEARLASIAEHAGEDVGEMVKDAVLRLIEEDDEFREAVRAGVAAADRGEFVEDEEMARRVRRFAQK